MRSVHFDPRWTGTHGIGRLAYEVLERIPRKSPLHLPVPKFSPLDPVLTSFAALRLGKDAVYFTPGFNPPLLSAVPVVFGLYDLILIQDPDSTGIKQKIYFNAIVRPAAARAARIITISEYSRNSILEWARVPDSRVVNVSCGVSDAFRPEGEAWSPGFPYLLFAGGRLPHKNIARLLAGFAASREARELRLLFSGKPDDGILEAGRRLGIESRLAFSGPVSDAQLASLYRGAVALVWPSLFEGFGLPIVEAMACGTPVLTSNVTATPETAGAGNAVLVNPREVDSIAAGIDLLAGDPALRAQLRARGLVRAKDFSWARVGDAVLRVLHQAG
jgi:glycosyltransferase involved in cell wall biosynthesis